MSVTSNSVILREALENDDQDTDEPKTILEIGISKPSISLSSPPSLSSSTTTTTTINNSIATHIHHHTQYYHPLLPPPPPPPPPPPLPSPPIMPIATSVLHRPAPHHWLTVPPPDTIGPPYSPVFTEIPEHNTIRAPNANWKERAKQIERGMVTINMFKKKICVHAFYNNAMLLTRHTSIRIFCLKKKKLGIGLWCVFLYIF